MVDVRRTSAFDKWADSLTDDRALAKIAARIRNLQLGHAGDAKSVGGGVSELRIHYGPGYRLYFTRLGSEIVILLCGGDKKTQKADIRLARQLAAELKE